MKTKTITALEQALADMREGKEQRHPDEFTSAEMQKQAGGGVSLTYVQRRLKALVDAGKYTKRRSGAEWLYRKSR